jgi:starch phosphorylase
MEVAIDASLPTYSGGLGVLAGDYIRSAADLGLPIVAVTLLYRDGYFRQLIEDGGQVEEPVAFDPEAMLQRLDATVAVEVAGAKVAVGAWKLDVRGAGGGAVPIVFLDTNLQENAPADRDVTDQLYGGDNEHRLRQEAVLGLGGVAMLRELGWDPATYHMNEGHSSLLTLRLLEDEVGGSDHDPTDDDLASVRQRCVFTTHTPVPAGHDRFAADLVLDVLGPSRAGLLDRIGLLESGMLNMTELGVRLSKFVNGVSLRHRQVAQAMMPGTAVRSVTNGVHAATWTGPHVSALFDEHLPGWQGDNALLRYATGIPLEEIGAAHAAAKTALLAEVAKRNDVVLDPAALTLGLARRVTPYKRTTLPFSDLTRLAAIAAKHGPLQILASGKAHPRDEEGKELIAALVALEEDLTGAVRVVFLTDYDVTLAALLCAGADVWLNVPEPPLEASGTSGMKAALNGVPSLSILDGWWVEGCVEGVTGWAIGEQAGRHTRRRDAGALYAKLGEVVAPAFFGDAAGFLEVRRNAIALNGSFFNTERMAREYAREAYGLSV